MNGESVRMTRKMQHSIFVGGPGGDGLVFFK